jgi:hypothetical protein
MLGPLLTKPRKAGACARHSKRHRPRLGDCFFADREDGRVELAEVTAITTAGFEARVLQERQSTDCVVGGLVERRVGGIWLRPLETTNDDVATQRTADDTAAAKVTDCRGWGTGTYREAGDLPISGQRKQEHTGVIDKIMPED